jgi:pilus assembly protein CpaD
MRTPTLLIGAALIALAPLAGCASMQDSANPPLTPLSRYSLQVEPGLDRIALAVHDDGLSPTQHAALRDLASRYARSGYGAVRVEAPAGDDPAAGAQAYATRAALQAFGVPAERILVAAYPAPDPRAPVLAGFETVRASIPNCAGQHGDLAGNFTNQSTPGFGCAVTANMAAQIDDPRDILGAKTMSPPDSGRAAVVFDNYRRGVRTSAPQDELIRGRIARAVE